MAHPVFQLLVKGRLCEHVSAGGGTEGIVSEYLSIDFFDDPTQICTSILSTNMKAVLHPKQISTLSE